MFGEVEKGPEKELTTLTNILPQEVCQYVSTCFRHISQIFIQSSREGPDKPDRFNLNANLLGLSGGALNIFFMLFKLLLNNKI